MIWFIDKYNIFEGVWEERGGGGCEVSFSWWAEVFNYNLLFEIRSIGCPRNTR